MRFWWKHQFWGHLSLWKYFLYTISVCIYVMSVKLLARWLRRILLTVLKLKLLAKNSQKSVFNRKMAVTIFLVKKNSPTSWSQLHVSCILGDTPASFICQLSYPYGNERRYRTREGVRGRSPPNDQTPNYYLLYLVCEALLNRRFGVQW